MKAVLRVAFWTLVGLTIAQVMVGLIAIWLWGTDTWDPGEKFPAAVYVGSCITGALAFAAGIGSFYD